MRTRYGRLIEFNAATPSELPTEFRLFKAGWNESQKGSVLFDEQAAKSVMQAFHQWGVDLMIDLEHQAIFGTAAEPTAKDSRGWFKLEVRSGELWATNVKWTDDGASRVLQKRQRYISPAFHVDQETSRVVAVLNVALVSMPATNQAIPLIAASIGAKMDPKMVKDALEALIAGDSEKAASMLKDMIAGAASGDAATAPAEEAAVPMSAEPPESDASGEEEEEEKKELGLIAASIITLSQKATTQEALAEIAAWKVSHVALEEERARHAKEKAALEMAERRRLCTEIVRLGIMNPAAVWADDDAKSVHPLLANVELAHLRSLVTQTKKRPVAAPQASAARGEASADTNAGEKSFQTPSGVVVLSARELETCSSMNVDPTAYAKNKAIHLAAKAAKEK